MSFAHRGSVRRLVWQLLQSQMEFPSRSLDRTFAEEEWNLRDRALAKELLLGVLRAEITLDCLILAYVKKRVKDPSMLSALRLGLYQLLFLQRIPHHAAIDATLEAMKPELQAKIGFLNAVLRTVVREAEKIETSCEVGRNVLPDPAWRFARKVFADPSQRPAEYLAETTGFPKFLIQRWWQTEGEERTRQRAQVFRRKAPLWIRVNVLRSSVEEVSHQLEQGKVQILQREGVLLQVRALEASAVPQWPGYDDGRWSVQDLSSFRSVALAAPTAGDRILDLCAAPGGKAFAAFELAGGDAEILACDIAPKRLARLEEEARRLGHPIETLCLQADGKNLPCREWSLIIADVPCSNTGVLHKRPEARARFGKKTLHELETMQNLIQKHLIVPALGEQSRVLWSTCSLEQEENQMAVARLAKRTGKKIRREELWEPSFDCAGGFAALLG